uniref:Uncharacterized protein n=1 Tax=Helianthus annuus TaxID=4232 RepID=A0A251UVZ5_HELAN
MTQVSSRSEKSALHVLKTEVKFHGYHCCKRQWWCLVITGGCCLVCVTCDGEQCQPPKSNIEGHIVIFNDGTFVILINAL